MRDGLNEEAAQRRELEKCLDKIKMKDQGGDAVVLTDLCRSLELPIAKPGGGMTKAALVEQIVAALLAELPAGACVDARKAAFVDASLQELRRVRDGLNEEAAQRRELEKCLDKIKMKDQGGDAVVLTDLCRSLELPIAKPSGGWMKKRELVEQIISTLLGEGFVPCSDVDKSSFDMAMEICRSFDESRCDLDSAVRRACNTVESCVCLGSVLMGTDEEELLRRHKGLDYWVEQIVQVLAGFCDMRGCFAILCHRMFLAIYGFSQQILSEIDLEMMAHVVVRNVSLWAWPWSFARRRNVACGLSCLELLTRLSLGRAFGWFWNI